MEAMRTLDLGLCGLIESIRLASIFIIRAAVATLTGGVYPRSDFVVVVGSAELPCRSLPFWRLDLSGTELSWE